MKRLLLIALFSGVLMLRAGFPVQSQDSYIRSPHLGIDHVSAPSDPILDQRYRNALFLGAGWNRWPLYWYSVEQADGNFNWGAYDQLVANDVRYGLQSDAIFLGAPTFDASGGSIQGLNQPVFSDGSDTPGGKQPNPGNPYARFVFAAVQRYKPGGTLAQQLGWGPTQGIRTWEAWNEPDLALFWGGSVMDYVRLLKVTYLIVRDVDPLAQVMFAGLAYNNPLQFDFFKQALGIIQQDPTRNTYNWFFDIAAVHSYSSAYGTESAIGHLKQDLIWYGLQRPIWLNESGIPVWDDYPGPTWTAGDPAGHQYRGTLEEQALYVIESTTLAWASGADVVFIFQLYDDCGNQPSGTTFAPNTGQAGDAYGLFRNDKSSPCFNQSPQPNSPRPAAGAYYRLAQIFGGRKFSGGTIVNLNGKGTVAAFDLSPDQGVTSYGPVTAGGDSVNATVSERAYVMWNTSPDRLEVEIPSSGQAADLYDMGSNDYMVSPQNGVYDIGLPAVDPSQYPDLTAPELSRVSGAPFIMIEQIQPGWTPVDPNLIHVQGENATPNSTAPSTQESVIPAPPTSTPVPPTLDPALDHTPPVPQIDTLPATSPATFTVRWGAQDDSGIASYIVWVRVNGGQWTKWLQTRDTHADYSGAPGSTYDFALWAVDLAGNWSANVNLTPMATTMVQ